jgi:hypothetical protein
MRTVSFSRKRRARYRSNHCIRAKKRPVGRHNFAVEVRLVRTIVPEIASTIAFSGERQKAADVASIIADIRTMVGGRYKIIRHTHGIYVNTTILFEREEDVVFLGLLGRELIHRAYRYV